MGLELRLAYMVTVQKIEPWHIFEILKVSGVNGSLEPNWDLSIFNVEITVLCIIQSLCDTNTFDATPFALSLPYLMWRAANPKKYIIPK